VQPKPQSSISASFPMKTRRLANDRMVGTKPRKARPTPSPQEPQSTSPYTYSGSSWRPRAQHHLHMRLPHPRHLRSTKPHLICTRTPSTNPDILAEAHAPLARTTTLPYATARARHHVPVLRTRTVRRFPHPLHPNPQISDSVARHC
jgi:hypothetical protein